MAKGSGIELTPAQAPEVEAPKMVPTSPTKIIDKGRVDSVDNEDNLAISSGTDSDISAARIENSGKELAVGLKGQRHDLLDDDEAERLAGLINGAGLSAAGGLGANMAVRVSEGIITRSYKVVAGFLASRGTSAGKGEAGGSKIGPQRSGPHEEASRIPKTRSLGKPDPYEVPQSPPRKRVENQSRRVPKSKAIKSKRTLSRATTKKAIADPNELHDFAEEREREPQEQYSNVTRPSLLPLNLRSAQEGSNQVGDRTQLTAQSSHRESRAQIFSEAHHTPQKRTTRSMRARENEPDINDRLTPDIVQRTSVKESPILGNSLRPTSLRSKSTREVHDGRGNDDLHNAASVVQYADSSPQPVNVPSTVNAPSSNVELEEFDRNPDKEAESAGEGVSSILLNPSPIKLLQKSSKQLQRPIKGVQKEAVESGTILSAQKKSEYMVQTTKTDDEGSNDDDDDVAEREAHGAEEYGRHSAETNGEGNLNKIVIPQAMLKNLLSIIDRVGRNALDEKVIMDADYATKLGKTLSRTAQRLSSKNAALKRLKSAGIVDLVQIDAIHETVIKLLTQLGDTTNSILTDRLGPRNSGGENGDDNQRKSMLRDLYLYGIPDVVKALCSAERLLQSQPSPAIQDLEELFTILKCVFRLAVRARHEPTEIQPRPNRYNSYQISDPTRKLLPIFKSMYKILGREIKARRSIQRRTGRSSNSIPQKRLIESKARVDEEEYQRRLKERNREIHKSLNVTRAELGLVLCSQAKTRDKDDVFVTGLLGQNNSHPGTIPKEWSHDEMKILVAGLRHERGPLRYQYLTDILDRTIDEIYDRAKYLRMQIEYTLKRLQEEQPGETFPSMKPWIENIGSERIVT